MMISVAIQSCPPRAARAADLARALAAQVYAARAYGHDVQHPVITTDVEQRGVRYGAALAWSAMDPAASHHLVIQDDVIPCADFLTTAATLIALHPGVPLSFCSLAPHGPGPAPSMRISRRVLGAQAIAMPAALARTAASYLARSTQTLDDEAMGHVFDALQVRLLSTFPSLVQHDVTEPSLAKHGALVARDFVGQHNEARFLPWRDAPTIHEVF